MKRLILLILGLAPIFSAFAQGELSPAYSITADSDAGYLYLPDSCWQMMADATGKMSFQDAIRSNLFQATDKKINYHYNTYWLRYKIVNRMNKKVNIYASFNQDIEAVNLYVKSGTGSWKHYKSGILVPWKERDGLKSLVAIPLTIPSGNTITIYEKCSFNYTISSPRNAMVYFNFKKGIDKRQGEHYSQSLWSVFLLGILLLAVIINLYFFIIVREKEFLFFTLFLLSLALFRIAGVSQATGYIGDVFFKNYPAMQYYLTVFSGTFYDFLLIYSIRHALKTYHDFPRWDKYLIVLSLATIILSICAIFEPAILHKNLIALITFTFMGLGLIIDISLLITILFYVRSKDIIMRMMVYALVPYSIFSIVMDILAFPANISYLFSTPFRQAGKYMIVVWKLLDIGRTLGNICFIWMIVLFACVLFMRFARLRRRFARERLERERERRISTEQQKTELEKQVAERTSELKLSLEDLQSTQKQLIQSEKMASLGELTAGIAHEIQNPLNFVNNFSEVSVELIGEMNSGIGKGDMEEVKNISNDLTQNLQKINFHGKRADAIVKSMLQHSRTSSGKKEPTNINALADEYLRLSYHGMRAKDKSFNATMKTDFDETIGKINIVPQDIGRVLLNLYNNAFYACAERSRSTVSEKLKAESLKQSSIISTGNGQQITDNSYVPIVTVVTRKLNDKIEMKVKDNGNGIPEKVKDKIFQPFFTTKPTGEGTGLGLSLSYDIIKAHDGDIKVETREGEARPDDPVGRGTEFVVVLPA